VEYDREERSRLGEQVNMLKSISSNLTSIFLSHGLLILIFNSFNIEKKFYHEKLLPTSIVEVYKTCLAAPPENFGLLGIRRRRLT
jgi:hypothetical protein